jgi:ribonuclease BN (tRNA processing enzyme)
MKIDVVCLGVGKGSTYVLKGEPSSAFAIRFNSELKILVDCGAGIALSCLRNLNGFIPNTIYISHNHMDHTGDLPVVLSTLSQGGKKPNILSHPDVAHLIQQHRLHPVPIDVLKQNYNWIMPDQDGVIVLGNDLSMQLVKSIHSYICYGFILYKGVCPILGYTADTDFDYEIYSMVTKAPVAIVSGRDIGNDNHASFDEINEFAKNVASCSVFVTHYEQSDYIFSSSNVRFLREGEVIDLA